MRIVIDTNVLVSGVFFGGYPKQVLNATLSHKITACATLEIIQEYEEITKEMIIRKQGNFNEGLLTPLVKAMELIDGKSKIEVCRDSDDNKFIECAKDAKALYIVSGDRDLLTIGNYEDIEIITAKEFCEKYINV